MPFLTSPGAKEQHVAQPTQGSEAPPALGPAALSEAPHSLRAWLARVWARAAQPSRTLPGTGCQGLLLCGLAQPPREPA